MDEFVDRMEAQRQVLNIVNGKAIQGEKLFGLSSNAIERWVMTNQLDPAARVVQLVKEVSSNLFFLATRSQEPVSKEYKLRRSNIMKLMLALKDEFENR